MRRLDGRIRHDLLARNLQSILNGQNLFPSGLALSGGALELLAIKFKLGRSLVLHGLHIDEVFLLPGFP